MKSTFRRTPQEAVRMAVDALGGMQTVGHALKGVDSDPILAGQWLSHCLQINGSNKHKLSMGQLAHILRESVAQGHPEGAILFCELIGLRAEVMSSAAQMAATMRRASEALHESEMLRNDLRTLSDNPRLLKLMEAAGLNLEALA